MLTRKGLDWTARFGLIARTLAELAVKAAYLDEEIVVVRTDGVSSFADLQEALSTGQSARLFDCAIAFEAAALGSAVAVSWFCRSSRVFSTALRAFVASAIAWSASIVRSLLCCVCSFAVFSFATLLESIPERESA